MKIEINYEGGSVSYLIPFVYLEKAFVKVEVNGVLKSLHIDYEINDNYVKFTRPTKSSDKIHIYRKTTTDRLVKFGPMSRFRTN